LSLRFSSPADRGKDHVVASYNDLRNELLASLPRVISVQVESELQLVSLSGGEVLWEPGEEVEYAYFPHTGMISLLAVMNDGSAIETATVGREGAVGLMTGLGIHITLTRATVQTPLAASRIGASQFRRLARDSEDLRDLIVRSNEALLAQVQMTAACNAVHGLEQRLSRWILQTRDRTDGDVLPLTHDLLSQMLGVRRSSVSEIAGKLQADGLISYRRGKVFIDDRDGLERNACECYEAIKTGAASLLRRR
jgi:CRP-like cAMP-binding protein